jgi:hypothetical protein
MSDYVSTLDPGADVFGSLRRMDSYSWGQTRTIEGDGKDKKMLVEADDYFEDSMIPLERFQGELAFDNLIYGSPN